MAIKKSQLYASLWQSCDELRGGMDASQYKDYILTLLFMKYVSDKAANNPYTVIQVPEGGSFTDMVKLRGGNGRSAIRSTRLSADSPRQTILKGSSIRQTSTTIANSAEAKRWWIASPDWWLSLTSLTSARTERKAMTYSAMLTNI